jgi:predicted DNA-binding transcriptional regulator AlpA
MQTPKDSEWWTAAETAEYIRHPLSTLYVMNSQRTGPPRYRIGRKVLYRRDEVIAWMKSHRVEPDQLAPAGK